MPLEKNDDRCDRKKFLTKVAVKCLRPLGRRSEAVDRNNLFGAKSCRVTDNKMSAPTFLMDVFLDPPYEISGSKHTRGEARQYMNRYGQVPSSNHVTHPLAASAASTKNDTGLSKETVALLTSCLKCARPCTFTDIAVGRSKFFALKPDIQEQMFDAYQHQFLRPAGHDWVPGICSKLHLLLCDRCTPTVCHVDQSCPYCDGSCRKRKMISDGEPSTANRQPQTTNHQLSTTNLEQWLLRFLSGNPYHSTTIVDNPFGLPLLLPDKIVQTLPFQYVGHLHTCRCTCRCCAQVKNSGQCNCHRACALVSRLGAEITKMSAKMDSLIEVFQKQTEVFKQKESEQLIWNGIAKSMESCLGNDARSRNSTPCVIRDNYKDDAMDIDVPESVYLDLDLGRKLKCRFVDCVIQTNGYDLYGNHERNENFCADGFHWSNEERRLQHMANQRPRLYRPWNPKTVLEEKKVKFDLWSASGSQPDSVNEKGSKLNQEEAKLLSDPQFITTCRDKAKLSLQCPVKHQKETELLQNLADYLLLRHGANLNRLAEYYPLRIGFAESPSECSDVVYMPCPENGDGRAAFISRHPQATISNCKGDVLCEAVPFDIDLWFDTEKLQKDLGEMLVPDFFQQYSTKVQPEKLAECATSQDIRMAEGMRVEKNHAVQDRLTRYLSQLSTLRWFQTGKQLGLSDEQLLQDTLDVGGMLAAMAKTPVV